MVVKDRGISVGDRELLSHAELNLQAGRHYVLIGRNGSGKSTLLKSVLGETYLHSGSVHVTDFENIAYCDEDPWILNQTIRDNIIAFSEYSEGFYNTVIEACQLKEDLKHLPQGDLSQVGSRGISLSGGQKARVVS